MLEGCRGFSGDSGLPTTSTRSLSSLSIPLVLSGLFSSELCLWAASKACLEEIMTTHLSKMYGRSCT